MTQSTHPPRPVKKRSSRINKTAAAKTIITQKKKESNRRIIFIVVAIVLVVIIAAGLFYYLVNVMPYQRVILSVGNDNIKTGYFLKRVAARYDSDVSATIDGLTNELLIKQAAASFGLLPATEEAINTYLYDQARGENETISDEEFNTWLNDQLASTGLTEKEYREIIGSSILAGRVQEIVTANVSSVVPQVHLSIIMLDSDEAATEAKARIDGGEDFATVAKEVSLDTSSKENGGDLGWLPTELLSSDMSSVIDVLDIGKCSDPFPYIDQSSSSSTTLSMTYLLFMVSEKSTAMEVTDEQLNSLKYYAMLDWLESEKATTQVTFHGLHGSTYLDNETLNWLNFEVQKLIKKRSSTS